MIASEIWPKEIAPTLTIHRYCACHASAVNLQGMVGQSRSQYKDMLSADGYLTHHLPPSVTMSVPISKDVHVVVAGVPPPEPDGVHAVMWEVSDAEEFVYVRPITANFVPT